MHVDNTIVTINVFNLGGLYLLTDHASLIVKIGTSISFPWEKFCLKSIIINHNINNRLPIMAQPGLGNTWIHTRGVLYEVNHMVRPSKIKFN